jgi:hypothetical protein
MYGEKHAKMAQPSETHYAEGDGVTYKAEGDEHARARRYEEADRSYTRSLVAAPDLHTTWGNRSLVRLKLGMADGAAGDAQQCTALAPDWPKGWARRGAAERARQRPGVAAESYARARALEPDNPEYERLLAEVRAEAELHPDAPADEDYSGSEDEGEDDRGGDGPWDYDDDDDESEHYYYSEAALPPPQLGGTASGDLLAPGAHSASGSPSGGGGGCYFGGAPLPSVIPAHVSEAAYVSATAGAAHLAAVQGATCPGGGRAASSAISNSGYGAIDGSRGGVVRGDDGLEWDDRGGDVHGDGGGGSGGKDTPAWERELAGEGEGGGLGGTGPSLGAIQQLMAQCLEQLPREERAGLGREEQLALMMATLEACPSR